MITFDHEKTFRDLGSGSAKECKINNIMKIKLLIKAVSVYLLICCITILLLELLSRAVFPEHSKTDDHFRINLIQNLKYRFNSNEKIDFNKKTVWLFGDSVTYGYGLKYSETYHFQLDNILKRIGYDYNFLATYDYGSDLRDMLYVLTSKKNLFKKNDIIVYQFNYNDIKPHNLRFRQTPGDLEDWEKKVLVEQQKKTLLEIFLRQTNVFVYKYLNTSVFLKTLRHYAIIVQKKTSGKCDERGLDALHQYTYAYGSKGYEKNSILAWNLFYKNLIKTKNIVEDLNLKFIVIISPISLQLPHHEKNNIFNLDLNCATIDPYNKIKGILIDANIEYADPLPLFLEITNIDFNERKSANLFIKLDTNHPTAYGHSLLAYSMLNKFTEID